MRDVCCCFGDEALGFECCVSLSQEIERVRKQSFQPVSSTTGSDNVQQGLPAMADEMRQQVAAMLKAEEELLTDRMELRLALDRAQLQKTRAVRAKENAESKCKMLQKQCESLQVGLPFFANTTRTIKKVLNSTTPLISLDAFAIVRTYCKCICVGRSCCSRQETRSGAMWEQGKGMTSEKHTGRGAVLRRHVLDRGRDGVAETNSYEGGKGLSVLTHSQSKSCRRVCFVSCRRMVAPTTV
jgi:hypothetical protein